MAYEVNLGQDMTRTVDSGVTAVTLTASGDYSSGGIAQYSVVKLNASGKIGDVIVATTGDFPDGIIQTNSKGNGPGNTCAVRRAGISKVLAGAAITLGDLVYVGDTSGRVKTVPADGATSVYIVGQALEAATAAGDVIMVQLQIGSQHVTA